MCRRRFGAFQGRSGRFVTHQSVPRVSGPPEATSVQHVILSGFVVAHQLRTGASALPEPISVQKVEATSQGVTHKLLCRGLVAERTLRLRSWLIPDQAQCCQACRGSGPSGLSPACPRSDTAAPCLRYPVTHIRNIQKAGPRARGARRCGAPRVVDRWDAPPPPSRPPPLLRFQSQQRPPTRALPPTWWPPSS